MLYLFFTHHNNCFVLHFLNKTMIKNIWTWMVLHLYFLISLFLFQNGFMNFYDFFPFQSWAMFALSYVSAGCICDTKDMYELFYWNELTRFQSVTSYNPVSLHMKQKLLLSSFYIVSFTYARFFNVKLNNTSTEFRAYTTLINDNFFHILQIHHLSRFTFCWKF